MHIDIPAMMTAAAEHDRHRFETVDQPPRGPFDGMAVGRMVHFVLHNGEHRAATVVRIIPPTEFCDLADPNLELSIYLSRIDGIHEPMMIEGPIYDPTGKHHHTWHWPEHV